MAETRSEKIVALSAELAKFLDESGLLFTINRDILHPLGLAMSVTEDEQGSYMGKMWVVDAPEGIIFSQETFDEGVRKYNQFLLSIGVDKKLRTRREKLGYVVQPREAE